MIASLIVIALITLSSILGCTTPKHLSREEWLQRRSPQLTSRTFPNTTVDAVLKAGGNVLILADPSDVNVQHFTDKIIGTRMVILFGGIPATEILYTFDLTAVQIDTNVKAVLSIDQTLGYDKEAYDLFFDRMSALLYGSEWPTCLDRDPGGIDPPVPPLCWFAADNIPEGAKLSLKSKKAKEERSSPTPPETGRR